MAIIHRPVMLEEAVRALHVQADGFYVDCTFGGGGHSAAILRRLNDAGNLLAFDRDPGTLPAARRGEFADPRFRLVQDRYARLGTVLEQMQRMGQVNGILFDLGVSSMQLDDPGRGFSFRYESALDMRMDPRQSLTAGAWLNGASEGDIADVLYHYGDERRARQIARGIVAQRAVSRIETTRQLSELVAGLCRPRRPGRKGIHPATKTFQAIRIFINRELDELRDALRVVPHALRAGGRLVAISFHSTEDRIVKRFIRDQQRGGVLPACLPVIDDGFTPSLRALGRAQRPGAAEVHANPRARSAVLRVAERLARVAE